MVQGAAGADCSCRCFAAGMVRAAIAGTGTVVEECHGGGEEDGGVLHIPRQPGYCMARD